MVATRGPIPKRSEERRRQNEPEGVFTKQSEDQARAAGIDLDPGIPAAGGHWEEQIADLYRAIAVSPGATFMYAADWHVAWALCEQWDQNLKPQFVGMQATGPDTNEPLYEVVPMKGATLSALLAGFRALGITEEARRRMGHEAPPLQHAAERAALPSDADVVATRDELQAKRQERFL